MKQVARRYIVGIDEVGRGPLAGPVTVAALLLGGRHDFRGLRDSKKLSARQREVWASYIRTTSSISYALASVSPKVIDRVNIRRASNLAATRALLRLIARMKPDRRDKIAVFLDGGLYLNRHPVLEAMGIEAKTVVKGDEKIDAVKLASIIAKVSRDRYMKRLHAKYPAYALGTHKGYGTERHVGAIRKHGPSAVHRLTFIKNIANL